MIELAAWQGQVCGSGESNLAAGGGQVRKSPRPLAYSWGTREPGARPAPACWRPSVAAPRSPPLPLARRLLSPRPEKQDTHKVSQPKAVRKVEARPGSRASKHGRGWSGAQAGGDGKGLSPNGPPP